MTQRRTWLRTAHRAHAGLTIVLVLTLLALRLSDLVTGDMALRLFLAIELPMLAVFTIITTLRLREVARTPDPPDAAARGFLDRLAAEEPLLRPVVVEIRSFLSLCLAIRGRRRVPAAASGYGYTQGTMTFPIIMVALSLVELVVVHLLVPWPWLRIVLLVLTVWGVVFMLGYLATRVVNPHLVSADALTLRWGHHAVLTTPMANVASAQRHTDYAHTEPHAERDRLVLTQFQPVNVRVVLTEAVAVDPPVARRRRPADFRARELLLSVDDPDAFVRAVRAAASVEP